MDGIFDEDRDRNTLVLTGPRRDTVMLEEKSWVVIRFIANNPGVWLFHCHIDWHMLTGMSTVFVVGRKELEMQSVDDEARQVCRHRIDATVRGTDPPIAYSSVEGIHMSAISLIPFVFIKLVQYVGFLV